MKSRSSWRLALMLLLGLAVCAAASCSSSTSSSGHPAIDDDASPSDDDSSPSDDDDDQSPSDDDDDASPGDDDNDDDTAPDDDDDDDDSSPIDDDTAPDDDDDNDTAQTVWTDPNTGNLWQNGNTVGTNVVGPADAASYCANLTWDGYAGWQLPDIDQLRSLIQGCAATAPGGSCGVTDACLGYDCWNGSCYGCGSLAGPGPGGAYWPPAVTGADGNWYWSASVPNAGDQWLIEFNTAHLSSYNGVSNLNSVRCVHPAGACNATSCPNGCCDGSGVCWASSDATCGTNGATCVACGGADVCTAGTCTAGCDATTCQTGCCDGTSCAAGTANAACGVDGAACVACAGGQECVSVAGGGACVCNAASCASGCCDANGVCQTASDATCGVGGAACVECSAGDSCTAGVCTATCGACTTGCCDGSSCMAGTATDACGANGAACIECPTGQECVSAAGGGACQCDATSCPTGCCDASGICQPGDANTVCGTAGASCADCTNVGYCSSQQACAADDAETVWTDPASTLTWQNGETVGASVVGWSDAQSYCASLTWGGQTGWQLPDIDQLRSLLRGCSATDTGGSCGVTDACPDTTCSSDVCDGCTVSGGPGKGGAYWPVEISGLPSLYWSATAVPDDGGDAWTVSFTTGAIDDTIAGGYSAYAVRCVQ